MIATTKPDDPCQGSQSRKQNLRKPESEVVGNKEVRKPHFVDEKMITEAIT